jgi:hypothetical protein
MDYYSFDRSKLWLNIVGLAICLWMVAYPFRTGNTVHASLGAAALFLVFAINCAFRIYSYLKLERVRKSDATEEEIVRAERRTGLVITIFSNVTGILLLLVFLIQVLVTHFNLVLTIFLAVCILCFAGILVLSIKNLKRFDRR